MFISIGPSCHPAGNLKKIGFRNESLPFDWLLCKMFRIFEYVNELINSKFKYFTANLIYNYRQKVISKNYNYVEFYHYDLIKNKTIGKNDVAANKNLVEMMNRRGERFMDIITNKKNEVVFLCMIHHTILIKDGLLNYKFYEDMKKFDNVGKPMSMEGVKNIIKTIPKKKSKKVISETFDKTETDLKTSEKEDKKTFLDEDKLLKVKE